MNHSLEGGSALVTGAERGFGLATVLMRTFANELAQHSIRERDRSDCFG